MPRYPKFQPVYRAFDEFLQRCVLDDRSLLWPSERPWTAENLSEVIDRFVGSPIYGTDLNFEQKLEKQMEGASSEHWMIICDVYYVFSLPSLSITFKKKVSYVKEAAGHAGLAYPAEDAEVWEPQRHGFVGTGQRYNSKHGQFRLILQFADRLKRVENPESIVGDASRMQKVLDQLLAEIPVKSERAHDMRHAMLYMAFPDRYEPSISTGHRDRIVKTYQDLLKGKVPEDRDEAIREIRAVLRDDRFAHLDRPFDFYDDLGHEWRKAERQVRPEPEPRRPEPDARDREPRVAPEGVDTGVRTVLQALGHTRNLILHGPPGGGKTYVARKAAEAFVEPQAEKALPRSAVRQRVIEDLATYEVLALALDRFGDDESHSVSEILEHPLVQARFRTSPVKQPRQNVWGHLQWHTSPESETVSVSERRAPYLFDKDDQSRWYLTQDGHEYVKENLSHQIESLDSMAIAQSTEDFVEWTTFHQSYAYEDFVEGLRPVQSEGAPEEISYNVVPGVFRRSCTRAAEDPENKYVLVIDEINRGNIAKIFGELITLLEDDKRLGEKNALTITLPYSGDEFAVPNNLYVIGTMNTADRSIALLDVALRRRFAFVELMPRPELLRGVQVESAEAVVPLEGLLGSLNRSIRQCLDRDHQIGHSYLLEVAEADEDQRADVLEFVWNNRIVPLLEEYFYSQRDWMADILAPFRTDVESELDVDGEEELDTGFARLKGDDLMSALAKLAERDEMS
jgi:MoxR-like ATPase